MAKVISMVQTFLGLGLLILVLIGMTQIVGAQIEIELKCSADKFYNLYRYNVTQMSTVFPDYVKSIKIVEGDGISLDSIRLWQYVIPGIQVFSKVMVAKEMLKSVDDENRSITFSVFGGDLMIQYTSFDVKVTVTPNDIDNIKESGCKVKLWIEYEKRTEEVHSPDAHIVLMAAVIKESGNYLLQ